MMRLETQIYTVLLKSSTSESTGRVQDLFSLVMPVTAQKARGGFAQLNVAVGARFLDKMHQERDERSHKK